MSNENPIRLICESCGGPIRYEINSGTYRCNYCGSTRAPGDQYRKTQEWKKIHQTNMSKNPLPKGKAFYHCGGCGADIMIDENEATSTCSFCGGSIVRREYTKEDSFPELIVPFEVTEKEAKEHLQNFVVKKIKLNERKKIFNCMDDLKGYYLPYQFVRGPINCTVTRDMSERVYHASSYVDQLAVNTNYQLDNNVLDECEPFDWDKTEEFSFGYVAGHRVKMQDVSGMETEKRVFDEIEKNFLPKVEKTMQTKGIDVSVSGYSLEQLPALIPVYFINNDKFCAVVNGQSGATALTFRKMIDRSRYWYVEPTLTALVIGLITLIFSKSIELTLYASAAVAMVAFTAFGQSRLKHEEMVIYKEGNRTKDNTQLPVFEEEINGVTEKVDIRFFTLGRILKISIYTLLFNFATLIIAAIHNFVYDIPLSQLHVGYIVIWLVISVPFTFIFWIAYLRRDIYDVPLFYKHGTNKRIKVKSRYSIFSMIKDTSVIAESFWAGLLLFGLPLLMFIMSIYLIITG